MVKAKMDDKDLGQQVETLYQSFRVIKKFSESANTPETIASFMRYSIDRAKGVSGCPHDFDRTIECDALRIIKEAYLIVESEYNSKYRKNL